MKMATFLLLAQTLLAEETPKVTAAMTENKSVIVIDPKARASDYVQAFDMLRKDKPTLKIMIRTVSAVIPHVSEISAATSGTLLFIKVLSNQGAKIQPIPVEEIMEMTYSP
jgi:hypothetical protein